MSPTTVDLGRTVYRSADSTTARRARRRRRHRRQLLGLLLLLLLVAGGIVAAKYVYVHSPLGADNDFTGGWSTGSTVLGAPYLQITRTADDTFRVDGLRVMNRPAGPARLDHGTLVVSGTTFGVGWRVEFKLTDGGRHLVAHYTRNDGRADQQAQYARSSSR